jgi:nucleoside 2-deoxyribosyltransferase
MSLFIMDNKIVIYPAAALFNARETYFNSHLVERLEDIGYETKFPQRDGFEFGNLARTLDGKVASNHINSAVQDIIYFLDMGVFVPKSDVVLANYDEPQDAGVLIEATYAELMGKLVIGMKTDVRSPYGSPDDRFGGMHFFPAYQCDVFISHHMPSKTPKEREQQFSSLVQIIDETIKNSGIAHREEIPDYATLNPKMRRISEGAKLLFENVSDIHSDEGLETISSRYIKHKKRLEEIGPRIWGISF